MKSAEEMTDDELRIAIAEWCGWKCDPSHDPYESTKWMSPEGKYWTPKPPPNYPSDLNAMWEAEERLTTEEKAGFVQNLYNLIGWPKLFYPFNGIHATARQRAIALVKTIQS